MKLNYKNTFLVGLAFMSIIAFWQLYDNVIPLLLTRTFHLSEDITGVIMAADNVLALLLLPLFGWISDRTKSRIGRRMPYIIGGTIVVALLLVLLPFIENGYAAGREGLLFGLMPFIVVLGLILIAMSVYRSPAVALMPDITPKPLRSRGNAVINLMGAAGGIIYLAFTAVMFPKSKTEGVEHVDYTLLFIFMAVFMAVCIAVLALTVREPVLAAENDKIEKEHPEWNLTEETKDGGGKLPAPVLVSMIFLLVSIALWYISYNAVTTWFTTYISVLMGEGLGGASTCFLVANVGAIVSYIPIGAAAARFGRKKLIYFGTLLMTASFGVCYFLTTNAASVTVPMYITFALVGVAWAAISVNSLPMAVEMCKGADAGRYTGLYYTASMAGQVVTPIFAGFLLKNVSYKILFIYATAFAFASFLTMTGVKHGDVKAASKKGLENFEEMD
uniref:Sucrose transport protein n=1 Tax=uncultured bacterium Contig783 TaxID=1393612 RepID=W0FIR9_9BACT|nr:sucrose transport protein [uncultured bacterium Contig783]